MFTKTLKPIRSRRHLRARLKYAGHAEAKTHRDLSSIDVDFHGPADSTPAMIALSRDLEKAPLGRRQRPTEIVGFEIIISTASGAYLAFEEEEIFLEPVVSTLKALAYAIGRHRHKDGRTDFHVIPLNRSSSGGCLALGLISPKTGRKNRNLKRVMRAAADVGHDLLNDYRLKIGKPAILTMSEVIDKKIRERRERQEREQALLAEMDSANDVGPTENGFFPGDEPAKVQPDPALCEELTAKLHAFGRGELEIKELADWFDFSDGVRPRPHVEAVLETRTESAIELAAAVCLLAEILHERESELERDDAPER
jgi:hypothetical protein